MQEYLDTGSFPEKENEESSQDNTERPTSRRGVQQSRASVTRRPRVQ